MNPYYFFYQELMVLSMLRISGHKELIENYPDGKAFIEVRVDIVLPLIAIQHYALRRYKKFS
jgi:phosphoenolpyruvate carboxylase